MRSTVIIEDELFKRAKQSAAAQNTTLSAIVNQALRQVLTEPVARAPRFTVVPYGPARKKTHHEPADFAAALERDDHRSLR
jgi:hypothetical protein